MNGKTIRKLISIIAAAMIIFSLFGTAFAADNFETQISAFPESYKVQLRELHKKYPAWKFQCIKTGLDWNASVEAENAAPSAKGTKSAIHNSANDLLKDKSSGFYNASTGTYTTVDAGFVRANKLAISYFMDPRNFLKDTNIFQFEIPVFSSDIQLSEVDQVLSGTFMYNTKITYYDTAGNLKTTSETYAQCIYNAGKKYNVSPVYLASNIRGEVIVSGGNGSGSVTGKYPGYEGYYNFFNVGAYADATAPIANGLKYASSSGSYGRPWNTPSKAINGGAQFIAEGYMASGQNTGYFQKFNVAPKDKSRVYEHQYMSDVTAPDSRGYSTYTSNQKNNILSRERTFAIPVFENMPGADSQMKNFVLFDSYNQTATPTATLNVRTAPVTSASAIVSVRPETTVTVLSKCRTTAVYPGTVTKYPYWYYITFTQGGTKYTGYAVADYLNLNTSLTVNKGSTFTLPTNSTGTEKPSFLISDTSVVSYVSGSDFKAIKNGTAYITAYTSAGGYDLIKVTVGTYSNSSLAVSGLNVKASSSGAEFSWKAVSGASGYDIIVSDGSKTVFTKTLPASSTSVPVSSLSVKSTYSAAVRAFKSGSSSRLDGNFTKLSNIVLQPDKVTGLLCENVTASSFTLRWNQTYAEGYEVQKYNSTKKVYETVKTTKETSITFSSLSAGTSNQYKVRAYVTGPSGKIYGSLSDAVEGYTYKSIMTSPSISVKTDSTTLSWGAVSGANKYYVYLYDSSAKKYVKKGETDKTSFTLSSLTAGTLYKLMVEAAGSNSSKISGVMFTVKTLPNAVDGIKQTSSTGYKAKITWNAAKGADAYRIYVYDAASKAYNLLKEVATTSYTITGMQPCENKTIMIKAVVTNTSRSQSAASSDFTVRTGPKKPTKLATAALSYNSFTLKWSAVSGADSYKVYSVDSSGKSKLLGTTQTRQYTISSLKANTQYKFKVISCRSVNSVIFNGSESAAYTVKTAPSSVASVSSEKHSITGYTLTWKAVSGADGYVIYRYDSSAKEYKSIAKTKNTYYAVKNLYDAKKDSYKIAPYIVRGSKKYTGKISSKYSTATLPKNPANLKISVNSEGLYTVSWNKAARATGYKVYLLNSKTGKLTSLGTSKTGSYNILPEKFTTNKKTVVVKSYIYTDSVRYYSNGAQIVVR